MNFTYQTYKSPVGLLYIVAQDNALCGVLFQSTWSRFKSRFETLRKTESPVLRQAKRQLTEYFRGKRRSFELPLKLAGTPFQNRVWSSLSRIPFGRTTTYKQQAVSIKSPRATRAIGRTNGLNPLCIVLPCHRVIGSNGALTGYAGGLKTKKFLLELESTHPERN